MLRIDKNREKLTKLTLKRNFTLIGKYQISIVIAFFPVKRILL